MPKTEKVVDLEDERRKAAQLPDPTGFQLLIALPQQEEKTEGGIYVPDDFRQREETASITGMGLSRGPDAFADASRFPSGAYCKKGDWIIMQAYTGTRVSIHGKEFRLINDDCVKATIEDPRGVKRA
jgi:chaperonin GroES